MPAKVRLMVDKRSTCSFVWEDIKDNHPYLSLVFVTSIINPFFIRVITLMFSISISFSLNAMFFSASYIDNQAETKLTKGSGSTGFFYTLVHDLGKSIWPVIISTLLIFLTAFIIRVPKPWKEDLNNELFSLKNETKLEGM